MFSVAITDNNSMLLEYLLKIFNSDMGKAYEKICNMQAILLLLDRYKDNRTRETILINLKLIDEDQNLESLKNRLTRYQQLLSSAAKSIYDQITKSKLFI